MKNLSTDLIKSIKDDPKFSIMLDWVISKVAELNTLEGLNRLPNNEAGEEAKVRLKAANTLQEILTPFVDFSEKQEPTEQEIQASKQKYGL